MYTKRYNHEYYTQLIHILYSHNTYVPTKEEMPKVGFIAFDGETPISFCFLRMVEGGVALIDSYTSNPECSRELRHEGNDLVVKACINEAKELKLRNLIAFTVDASTIERSYTHGFVELQHTCIGLDLNRKG